MLDSEGRITIGKELLEIAKMSDCKKVYLFFDIEKRSILLRNNFGSLTGQFYFIKSTNMDEKGRIYIPESIRNAFKEASFVPAIGANNICILII